MLLYIMLYIVLAYLMLYIVLAYLMLFAALSNAVCLYNAYFCTYKALTKQLVCATTATAVLHHHMSLTCCIKSHCTPATLAPAHTPCLFSMNLHTVRQHLVIVHFLLHLLLSGTLFQMMSGVPHHCHHLSLV